MRSVPKQLHLEVLVLAPVCVRVQDLDLLIHQRPEASASHRVVRIIRTVSLAGNIADNRNFGAKRI